VEKLAAFAVLAALMYAPYLAPEALKGLTLYAYWTLIASAALVLAAAEARRWGRRG